jgi:hypothetical protein
MWKEQWEKVWTTENGEWRQVERRTNTERNCGKTGRTRAEKGGKGGVEKNIRI